MGRKREDLTGQKFGKLTVISLNEEVSKQKKATYWNCKCVCGNEVIVYGGNLKNSNTKSCGCYKKERRKELNEEMWQDEEFRQIQGDKMREIWKDEEFRQMQSDKASGDGNPSWKGGITPISIHLRNLNEQWANNCKQQANYTCELTGKIGKVNTHHLKAFNTIILEAHELHNIQVKPQIKDYTEEELHKLEEYVASWHKDNSNAVVLCDEVHKLFHDLYGKGNNTKEQFEEFKERYLNGEFSDLLGDDLNV